MPGLQHLYIKPELWTQRHLWVIGEDRNHRDYRWIAPVWYPHIWNSKNSQASANRLRHIYSYKHPKVSKTVPISINNYYASQTALKINLLAISLLLSSSKCGFLSLSTFVALTGIFPHFLLLLRGSNCSSLSSLSFHFSSPLSPSHLRATPV